MVEKSRGLFTGEVAIGQQAQSEGLGMEREWKKWGEGIIFGREMEGMGQYATQLF